MKCCDYECGPLVLPPHQLAGAACCVMRAAWGGGGGWRSPRSLWCVTGPESSRGCILEFVPWVLGFWGQGERAASFGPDVCSTQQGCSVCAACGLLPGSTWGGGGLQWLKHTPDLYLQICFYHKRQTLAAVSHL